MGLFSRKNHVGVASSVYNLAGDIANRPQVLRETVFSSSLLNRPLAPSITNAYLTGSGVRLRNFGTWAEDNFSDVVGFSSGSLTSGNTIVISTLEGEIPASPGYTTKVQSAEVDSAEYGFWADQYVAEYYPDRLNTAYEIDMDEVANQITITWADTSTTVFTPTGFDANARYLYASYHEVIPSGSGAVDTGATIVLDPLDSFPSTLDYDLVSTSTTPHTETLTETVVIDITYSDATPPTSSSSSTTTTPSYDEIHEVFEKYVTLPSGTSTSTLRFEKTTMYQDTVGILSSTVVVDVTTEDIGGGVFRTTTTTTTTDVLTIERSYRLDTQEISFGGVTPLKIFIYQEDTGNVVLDDMFKAPANQGSFMPFIPFRINNYDVKTSIPDIYPQCKKAFKKATKAKYDDVRDAILDNASIGDIDFCYAVFGVSLNTRDRSARRYLYRFFKLLSEDPDRQTSLDYDDWVDAWNLADDSWTDWLAWRATAGGDESWSWISANPEPSRLTYPTMPKNSLKIGSTNSTMNYNITLAWNFLQEDVLAVATPTGRRVGDYWFAVGTSVTYEEQSYNPSYDEENSWSSFGTKEKILDVIYIYWQETATQQRRMTIVGLDHNNLIWGGKSVLSGSKDAIQDLVTKEDAWLAQKVIDPYSTATKLAKAALDLVEESGFIVPMHQEVYRDTGLMHGTQTATACCYLVFNCYQVVKEKWYQTAFFRFVLIAVAIVITVLMLFGDGGTTLGATIATVTLDITYKSIAYYVVAFAINAVIATVLIKVFQEAATAIWDEEVGMVIGTIVGVLAFGGLNNIVGGNSLFYNFGDLMSITNLMKLTSIAGNAYAEYMASATQDIQLQTEKLIKEQTEKLSEVSLLMQEMFGTSGVFDPKEMARILSSPTEGRESFLQRTLLVGSDLANMSLTMLNNFTEITLSTELPKT